MLKTVVWIVVIASIIFISLTLITMQLESPFDGFDTFGFPLRFYTSNNGGKCAVCYKDFSFGKFLFDYVFALLVVAGLNGLYTNFVRK